MTGLPPYHLKKGSHSNIGGIGAKPFLPSMVAHGQRTATKLQAFARVAQ